MSSLLKRNYIYELNDLCSNMRDDLENMIYTTDDSTLDSDDDYSDE
jgi:hypothetical protein